jgi:hypothetical protein
MKNTKKRFTRNLQTGAFAFAALIFAACGEKTAQEPTASQTPQETSMPESIQLLDTKPEGAIAVKTAREQLKPGDEALVYGQIGGVKNPFFDGYAGFVLTDTDVMFCDEMGDDNCPTPWDACCEDSDKLKQSRASVQFVDAEGKILTHSLGDFAGLKGLDQVTVQGKVAPSSTSENLVIEARAIHTGE